ncbi:DUF4282 domain-containing protein [Acidihalobacter ferrooxydans]|uniref:DUF4282 domain-containing protein n=1 Tax=Acidihalobacter ferrooxydans TaxID=1765967 RepID=A0A1P8UHG9_9GAMM|nr:DUF4282 domain-containing protein [Acidihalobacter ferrooxydans]APZ43270.1 hypothetical protein BW247_09330 [Acidihalobacter ferrooxydans]
MRNIFFFDTMLTPKIITVVYWLVLLGVLFFGLSMMFGGYGGFTAGKFFMGLVYIIGGAIGVRIYAELLIVLFKMNEALQEMRHK